MFLAILIIYFEYGSLNYTYLSNLPISPNRQFLLWWPFFISFAVKIPMIPAHIWLPEAHVEAPTAGSVLLAGII
jgi:NADH:ubiquinone oxidoreductase subunit 4 (subunit M)